MLQQQQPQGTERTVAIIVRSDVYESLASSLAAELTASHMRPVVLRMPSGQWDAAPELASASAVVVLVSSLSAPADPTITDALSRTVLDRPRSLVHLHLPSFAAFVGCQLPRGCCGTCARTTTDCVWLINEAVSENAGGVDVRPGTYGSLHVRPRCCEPAHLRNTLENALASHRTGAVYCWTPVAPKPFTSESAYAGIAASRGLGHWVSTQTYSIFYKWNAERKDTVPPAMSSIAGAVAVIFSPDKTRLLMTLERRVEDPSKATLGAAAEDNLFMWRFPGGAVDLGESDTEALVRELREELGVVMTPESFKPVLHMNLKSSRKWGVFEEADKEAVPLLVNEHFTIFTATLDPQSVELKPAEGEIYDARWQLVDDLLEDRLEPKNALYKRLGDAVRKCLVALP